MTTRPFDVIVYGGTGFTGKLVARHLSENYQGKVKWALAGRDSAKLEQVRQELTKSNAACKVRAWQGSQLAVWYKDPVVAA